MAKLAEIQMQVMWNRLISVVEEQAQTLIRTAFGAATREALVAALQPPRVVVLGLRVTF